MAKNQISEIELSGTFQSAQRSSNFFGQRGTKSNRPTIQEYTFYNSIHFEIQKLQLHFHENPDFFTNMET